MFSLPLKTLFDQVLFSNFHCPFLFSRVCFLLLNFHSWAEKEKLAKSSYCVSICLLMYSDKLDFYNFLHDI